MTKHFLLILISSLVGQLAAAELSDTLRRQNAVVLYEFKEAVGDIIHDTSTFGAPLDLKIATLNGVVREAFPPTIEFAQNLISSSAPAKKIYDACTASKELSIEVWLQNGATSELLSGFYPNEDVRQPLRILSLTTGLNKTNFSLGQFYDATAKDQYVLGVKNANSASPVSFLTNAITTRPNELILPSKETDPNALKIQKVLFTLSKGQVASLYLSDRNGNMYLSQSTSNGFTSDKVNEYFAGWDSQASLVLGNELIPNLSALAVNYEYRKCTNNLIKSEPNCASPNRYWRGKLALVAVYCKAFSKEEVFGSDAYQIVKSPAFDVDPNQTINTSLVRARAIHQRITGIKTPASDPVLTQMATLLDQNAPLEAAALATQDPHFLSTTVRDFAAKMSNRDETIETPLNDFTATIIGAVRDDLDSRLLLSANIVYEADPKKASVPSDPINDILKSNNHYEALENGKFDLGKVLVRKTQKVFDGQKPVDNPTPAGLLTTRQWIAAHAIAGTNRRLVEYAFREFLCTPIDRVADATGPDNVIGRDIDRFPGGSHSKFTTSCRACHTVMDGFRPAFSQFTFNNNYFMHSLALPAVTKQADEDTGTGILLSRAPASAFVVDKLNKNETVFPEGRITTDDKWVNNANFGINKSTFGWTKESGQGIKDFGQMISESKMFPKCMAQRIFQTICKREPALSDETMLNGAADEFSKSKNYNLRFLFQKIVTSPDCLGGQQ